MFGQRVSRWAFVPLLLLALGRVLASPLIPANAGGGKFSTPAVKGGFAYVATGVTINTWNLSDPASPLLVSRTTQNPTRGAICGLAIVEGHLYACWSNTYSGGISIFSIADPAHPVEAGEFDDYVASSFTSGNGHLYIAGAIGIVALDVGDPLHPVAVGAGDSLVPSNIHVFKFQDGKLLLSGSEMIELSMLIVFDASDAAHPRLIAGHSAPFGVPSATVSGDYLIEAGQRLEVFDLRNPAAPAIFSENMSFTATEILVDRGVLYLFGATGVQTWEFSVPDHPTLLRTVEMD
ncbi:MAG: LVIVD repeat-containing protein, partial [Rhodanobacteraceae bacterium]